MMHLLQIPHGRQSAASALAKHTIRFGRRLRAHGIHHAQFPSMIDDGRSAAKVKVGKRNINVFNDGSSTPSLMLPESWLWPNGGFDHAAFASQSNRMHAIYLELAADGRRRGLKSYARADLEQATLERKHHERTRSI